MHSPNDWPLADNRNVKTIAECLADELINAAQGSSNWSTADSSSEAVSSKQKPIREKNKFDQYQLKRVLVLSDPRRLPAVDAVQCAGR